MIDSDAWQSGNRRQAAHAMPRDKLLRLPNSLPEGTDGLKRRVTIGAHKIYQKRITQSVTSDNCVLFFGSMSRLCLMGGVREMNNRRWICGICALVLLIAAGSGGYLIGKTEEAARYEKEREAEVLISRSEFEGLGDLKETIYVTGHKSPDTDTVGSSMAYAALLRELGYDAAAVILSQINNESAFLLKTAGLEVPEVMEDASGKTMVLVDHSEYTQSAEGLKDADIIGIIDHHGAGSVTTSSPLIYTAKPVGSTGTIVWLEYKKYGIEPSRPYAVMMLGAILSDTRNLQSGTTLYADREAANHLSKLAGISDTDAFYQEMYKELLSYEGKTDEEIYFTDYKEYEIGGRKISVGNVNAYDETAAKELAARMKNVMPQTKSSTGMEMCFSMVSITHDDS